MTASDTALLILAFIAVLVIVDAVWVLLKGPDPDLTDEPVRFAPCGDKDCRNPHPYRPWQERER